MSQAIYNKKKKFFLLLNNNAYGNLAATSPSTIK